VTFKQIGAAAHIAAVRAVLGEAEILARGPRGGRIVRAVRRDAVPALVAAGAPEETVEAEVLGRRFVFRVGPGVFARRGLDPGTRLLLETVLAGSPEDERAVLDLGCGYGALGIVLAAHRPAWRVVLADVDAGAAALAGENAARNGVAAGTEVRLSDGLRHLPGLTFDLIASHFPLHVGRAEQARLLGEARDALRPGGRLYLVALSAYDLRPAVRDAFGEARTLAEATSPAGDHYRVLGAAAAAPAGGA
jgi:16S rRNA (guanine1207-N2)-methyltransferase